MTEGTPLLELDWARWADGRVWRLQRDRDFHCDALLVHQAAQEASQRLGKPVRTVPDRLQPSRALWLQFADHEIPLGRACPCGGTILHRIHTHFARCASCGAKLLLREPEEEKEREADGRPQLKDFSSVYLMCLQVTPDVEHYGGVATDQEGEVRLIRAKVPLLGGERIPDDDSPVGFKVRVIPYPLGPIEEFIDLERLHDHFRDSWDIVIE